MKKAVLEALQELARVVLLAVVPVLITAVNDGNIDWRIVGTVALLAALRFVDKLVHAWGKETDNQMLITGLTRF